MPPQIDFRWRYQPRKKSDVQLMKYIQDNCIMGKTEMLLLAVRSFWLPYSLTADCTSQQLRSVAMDAVQVLRKQTKDILELAGLEDVSSSVQVRFTEDTPSQLKQKTVNSSSLNELRTQAGDNEYDDTGLNNFL
ncbi:hypothetical protein [Calothrix sp. CCY 0018]|uniref:hypothetical protein n=1 Tax=Calothrix sp. CCY 0018 TaxID=3103864 RepID=UPI0039C6C4F0